MGGGGCPSRQQGWLYPTMAMQQRPCGLRGSFREPPRAAAAAVRGLGGRHCRGYAGGGGSGGCAGVRGSDGGQRRVPQRGVPRGVPPPLQAALPQPHPTQALGPDRVLLKKTGTRQVCSFAHCSFHSTQCQYCSVVPSAVVVCRPRFKQRFLSLILPKLSAQIASCSRHQGPARYAPACTVHSTLFMCCSTYHSVLQCCKVVPAQIASCSKRQGPARYAHAFTVHSTVYSSVHIPGGNVCPTQRPGCSVWS